MDKRNFLFIFFITISIVFFHQWWSGKRTAEAKAKEQVVSVEKQVDYEVSKPSSDEKFYVLENEFQQIVFSNIGGSVAEMNLPFGKIINPIGFDRTLENKYPKQATFPEKKATVVRSGQQVTLEPKVGGYTPLFRRGPAEFNAMNVLVGRKDKRPVKYSVKHFTENEIVFEGSDESRRITKTFRFPKEGADAPYCIECDIQVNGDGRDLWLTSGVPEVELVSGAYAPNIRYSQKQGAKMAVEKVKLPKEMITMNTLHPSWVSNGNGFFGVIMNPISDVSSGMEASMIPGVFDPTRLSVIDSQHNRYPAEKYSGYEVKLPLQSGVSKFRIYAGPFQTSLLKQVDATYKSENLNFVQAKSITGWYSFIAEPFAKFLFFLLNAFHSFTFSWGFSIILLTIALRVMMFPLNNWSIKSTIRMQKVSPLIQKIQEKYKGDQRRMQMEMLQIYKKHKANPFSGCLPMLIQIPFLFGMFELLKTTFQLRGASFIPGWINNLAAPDTLFSWTTPVIFFGTSFHLLPFLLGGLMMVQSKVMGQTQTAVTDQQKQQGKMMTYFLPIFMTFIFYNFPAGLNIYWISSSLLDIAQRKITTKKLNAQPYEVAKKVK